MKRVLACKLEQFSDKGSDMSGYLVVSMAIEDQEAFQRYREQMPALIHRFGGRFVVRGGDLVLLEGPPPKPRLVIIEFPTAALARQFYDSPDYQPLKELRRGATSSDVVLVEGYSAAE
jgi:uncharacterized protein (DUF1330 family)